MHRRTPAFLLSLIVALSPAVAAQGSGERHPDFTGHWAVEGQAKDLPTFCGMACDITQAGDRLTVRGKDETHVIEIGRTVDDRLPLGFTLSTAATWAGDFLSITASVRAADGSLVGLPSTTVLGVRKGHLLVYNTSAVLDLVVQTQASYAIAK